MPLDYIQIVCTQKCCHIKKKFCMLPLVSHSVYLSEGLEGWKKIQKLIPSRNQVNQSVIFYCSNHARCVSAIFGRPRALITKVSGFLSLGFQVLGFVGLWVSRISRSVGFHNFWVSRMQNTNSQAFFVSARDYKKKFQR